MKARLIPVYFLSGKNEDFERQLMILKELLAEVADFLDPVSLGSALPAADAVVFPQLLGDAFKQIEELKKMADAKARALESEISMLRDEVKELRLLLSGEDDEMNHKKRK
jgi:hypothetical protein